MFILFFFLLPATPEIYPLSLHDALPISLVVGHLNILTITFLPMLIGLAIDFGVHLITRYEEELRHGKTMEDALRSEEHTSELQSLTNLVCRLLLEKKKNNDSEFLRTIRE